jgi:hypothetical protein
MSEHTHYKYQGWPPEVASVAHVLGMEAPPKSCPIGEREEVVLGSPFAQAESDDRCGRAVGSRDDADASTPHQASIGPAPLALA